MKTKLIPLIRAIRQSDLPEIYQIRVMDGTREFTTGLISERMEQTENWYKNLGNNEHILVAEIDTNGKKQVIGSVQLSVRGVPRHRHIGEIGIMVHTDFQGQGIGKKLMEEILKLADESLNLVRVQLTVITCNEKAIKLYESLGFTIEGTLKYGHSLKGSYADLFMMARYNVKD